MVPIRLEKLTKAFPTARGTVVAVAEVTLEIEAGELFFLLGPSGCGKTTLLRMLAGFVEPTRGRIHFGSRDVTALPPEARDAAMVFQNYALWPHMTVARNVAFGPQIRGVGRRQREQLVRELLETVRIAEKASAKPMELSGGQQQRVALARALAARPKCLLLDEPLSNLDATLRAAMRWEIRRIVKSSGTTAVYVTHDQAEALAIADRIAVMREGRIVQVGTGPELYDNPANRFVAEFLGEGNFLPAGVAGREGAYLVLGTPLGKLLGRGSEALTVGDQVTCCIRPECVRLAPTGQAGGGENALPARLTEWVHLGETARFRLELAGGLELLGAAMPARPAAAVGEELTALVRPEDVIVLPG
ncbi:MAG: hypothetical protein B1H04_03690 [Planctomycetales bacterium 4484_123]|nr:MAG: hypothetical protein B1H04_03690 [Planctomycetales bacterium 4484_123]